MTTDPQTDKSPNIKGLTHDEVAKVAFLARLSLTQDEIERFTTDLTSILGYANQVSQLDTANVVPTAHPMELVNVFRSDVVLPSLDRDVVLACAPAVVDNRFLVPQILGENTP